MLMDYPFEGKACRLKANIDAPRNNSQATLKLHVADLDKVAWRTWSTWHMSLASVPDVYYCTDLVTDIDFSSTDQFGYCSCTSAMHAMTESPCIYM